MTNTITPCTPRSRDITVAIPDGFTLSSGQPFAGDVRALLVGPDHGPVVVVGGGISAGHAAADTASSPGWWGWAIGDGAPIDTSRVRLLALDWAPETTRDEIVTITTADQARLLALVLDHLRVTSIAAYVGASYGGCVGLAFAEIYPERIAQLVVISAAHRAHPAATAWRGVQRRLLALGLETGREADAVALARQLAMTTYRSAEEFDVRFSGGPSPAEAGSPYRVCDYLIARGDAYRSHTTARRWISLSDSLDRHQVSPERILARLSLVGFTSDQLVPLADIRELANRAPNLDRLIEAPSLYGHDAFLTERTVVSNVLRSALSSLPAPCSQEIAA